MTTSGQPTGFVNQRGETIAYGVESGIGLGEDATVILNLTLGEYMDGSIGHIPRHPNGLWDVTRRVVVHAGLELNVEAARANAAQTKWVLRQGGRDKTL